MAGGFNQKTVPDRFEKSGPMRPGSSVFPTAKGRRPSGRSQNTAAPRAASRWSCATTFFFRRRYKVEGIEKPPEARALSLRNRKRSRRTASALTAPNSRRHLVTYMIPTVSGGNRRGGSCIISVRNRDRFSFAPAAPFLNRRTSTCATYRSPGAGRIQRLVGSSGDCGGLFQGPGAVYGRLP